MEIVYPRYSSSDFTYSPPRHILREESNGNDDDDCLSSKRLNNLRLESDFLHPNKSVPSSFRQTSDMGNDFHVPTNCQNQGRFSFCFHQQNFE